MNLDAVLIFHLGGIGGPAHSVLPAMSSIARDGSLETIVPEEGAVAELYRPLGRVTVEPYGALTYARRPADLVRLARRLVRETRSFTRLLRTRRPDVVVVVTTTLPTALVAARLARVPAVVYAAEVYEQTWKGPTLLRVWGRLLALLTARTATAVVCCSHTVARQFPRRRGARVVVAYPPIDPGYADGDRERGRSRHGVGEAEPCLAAVGALSRGRGQDVAIRTLALVRRRLPAARLVLVGEPHPRAVDLEFAEELRALARELGVAEAVVFAGRTGSMADLYAAADVVLNPARVAEAFGRVGPEALVAGTPLVASRVGAIGEVIRDGVDGLLVGPDDPAALATAVLRLWEDLALRERLVSAGREHALARYTAAANVAAWTAVVEGIAAR